MGWSSRHGRFERWALERVEDPRRRRGLIVWMTGLTMVLSLGLCALAYAVFGVVPSGRRDRLLGYGLPLVAPLLFAPVAFGALLRVVGTLGARSRELESEVKRRQQAESRLAILVTTDDLTQLANRRAFFAQAAEISSGTGDVASVAVLDVDEFKNVNDSRGHAAGDAVLRRVGQILLDTVDANGLAARLGGEEFGLILPHRTAEDALGFVDALREEIGATGVTVSIGVADWPSGTKIDPALAAADAALYRAKQRGRNRVELATPDDGRFGTDLAPVARR